MGWGSGKSMDGRHTWSYAPPKNNTKSEKKWNSGRKSACESTMWISVLNNPMRLFSIATSRLRKKGKHLGVTKYWIPLMQNQKRIEIMLNYRMTNKRGWQQCSRVAWVAWQGKTIRMREIQALKGCSLYQMKQLSTLGWEAKNIWGNTVLTQRSKCLWGE